MERRNYPRIQIRLPLTLRKADGTVVDTLTRDVAPGGLQLRCDRKTAYALHPSGRYIKRENAPKLDAELRLPTASGETRLAAHCRMVHLSVVDDGSIAIGIEFVAFAKGDSEKLARFLEAQMQPA